MPYLIKVLGYLFGDGTVNFIGKGRRGQVSFYGELNNLKEIKNDLNKICIEAFIYSRKREHKINTFYKTYKFLYTEHSLNSRSTSFTLLLYLLGAPLGNKTNQRFSIPKWLWEAPLWQKRLFIASFFGAELSKPTTLNKFNFYRPTLNINKAPILKQNAIEFLKEIRKILNQFGIKTSQVIEVEELGNRRRTMGLRLQILGNPTNLLRFFKLINFEYSKTKRKLACLAIGYLQLKEKIIKERDSVREMVRNLYKIGISARELVKQHSNLYIGQRFIEHSIWSSRGEPRIAYNFLSFDDFIKQKSYGEDGLIIDEIESITKENYQGIVYDLTIKHPDHNFIANNFIVSNCGMKLLRSDYFEKDIKPHLEALSTEIQKEVPSGLGRGRQLKLDIPSINKILEGGAQRLVEQGYGEKEDLENCESQGKLSQADSLAISDHAKNRGRDQVGTLGSGNHFLEIQKVAEIFDEKIAESFGLFKDQIVIMIHTGSRGLGHQIATDYIRLMMQAMTKYDIRLPDRELAACPINSPEGKRYFSAMSAGANYAWANRQMIAHFVRKAWKSVLGEKASPLRVVYDVAHNIAKIEKYKVNEKEIEICIHRKGATRAFPPDSLEIPKKYQEVGQPVLIPGSMGTASYVLVGQKEGKEAWFSTCFTGDTKLLTNKGIFTFSEIYKRFYEGKEEFLIPSFNGTTYQFEWKPITEVMVRKAPLIEVEISQTGRSRLNTLKVTPDHKFITLSGPKFIKKEISKIIEKEEMVSLADKLPGYNYQLVDPQLAYVVGAIMTDGSVYSGPGNGQHPYRGRKITFVQKKIPQKLNFINYVQSSFQNIFDTPLREYREKTGGGYIRGKLMQGTATDFVCTQARPIQQLSIIQENLVSWILSLSEEATFNFLAGIIDGDGTWHPDRKIIDIFNGEEKITSAIVIACLKLGILPYVSKQRGNCYVIQISEKIDEIAKYTKRVKSELHLRKYGTKLFSARQLFKNCIDFKWPFLQKAKRNNLLSKENILKYLDTPSNSERYSKIRNIIEKIISSPLRMQRVKKNKDLGIQKVFNITVKDNHNYVVLTDLFSPVLVANCHGAGRTMSRHEAMRRVSGQEVVRNLEKKGIIIKCWSLRGIAEEAPMAYKNIHDVVDVVHNAGLSKKVARLTPLAVIKGE